MELIMNFLNHMVGELFSASGQPYFQNTCPLPNIWEISGMAAFIFNLIQESSA